MNRSVDLLKLCQLLSCMATEAKNPTHHLPPLGKQVGYVPSMYRNHPIKCQAVNYKIIWHFNTSWVMNHYSLLD